MSIGIGDITSPKASCSCRSLEALPIFSVVDLAAFEHDPTIEKSLRDFPYHSAHDHGLAGSRASADSTADSPKDHFDATIDDTSRTSPCADDSTTVPDLESRCDSSVSSSTSDNKGVLRDVAPAKIPEFVDVYPEEPDVPPPSRVLRALHQLQADLLSLDVSAVEYCESLRITSVQLSPSMPPRGHIDGGALATTTDRKSYLWSYRDFSDGELSSVPRLRVADDTTHRPTGVGYICIPQSKTKGSKFVRSYYTPEIPATIVSPDAFGKDMGCRGYQTYSDFVDGTATLDLIDCGTSESTVSFDLQLLRGLLFTDSLVAPTPEQHVSVLPPISADVLADPPTLRGLTTDLPVRALTRDQQRALWHMRLGHVNERTISDLHHYVDGVPSLPRAHVLDSCPICKRTKLHKANRGGKEDAHPTECWQDIQIDFGFFVQKSAGRSPPKSKASASARRAAPSSSAPSTKPPKASPSVPPPAAPKVSSSASDTGDSPPPSSTPAAAAPSHPARRRNPTRKARAARKELRPLDVSASSSTKGSPSSETYTFDRILTHEGPLSRDHKRYKGHAFNVKILWSTKQTTWEPLHIIFEDAPDDVLDYARQHNLLSNPDWALVQDYALYRAREPVSSSSSASMADVDDETELVDGTLLDDDSTVFAPMDDTTVAAKAAAAYRRYKRLVGLNGETCYVLITDRLSGVWKISIRRDKQPPLDFFKEFIATHGSSAAGRRVRFDGGGELGGCTDVHDLFAKAGYSVEVTAPDSSSEIGQVERPHRTIADGVRTMLFAAGLPFKYWPYALRYFVFISNCLPRGDRPEAAITMCTGRRVNVSLLRIFGCRIYALPSSDRDAKLDVHARPGIFLGYKKSMRNAYYVDLETGVVKTARHIAFDEGMIDSKNPPPFVQYLRGDLDKDQLHLDDATSSMQVSLSPFNEVDVVDCRFRPSAAHPLGFQVGHCPKYLRAYATAFNQPFGPHDAAAANRRYLGGYILKVGQHFTFSPDDVQEAIRLYASLDKLPRLPFPS